MKHNNRARAPVRPGDNPPMTEGKRLAATAAPGTPILHTLANGVRLLAIPMPHVQSASVGIFLRVGSRDETPQSNGIGHVLEHMAFKGTATRTAQEINLDAERLGADVNAFTAKDITGYFMTGLGRHAGQLLRMTADIVLNSTFPEDELQRELEVIRQEAIEYEEDPEDCSSELLDRAIWGDHAMGMPVIGTLPNIERFTRDDLVRHVQSHHAAEKTVVAAAGNFDVAAFLALGETLFAHMPRGDGSTAVVPAAYVGRSAGRRFTQVSQAFLNIAWPVAPSQPQELAQQRWRIAASLAVYLFGEGMSSPLVDQVRERLGLAYSTHSAIDAGDAWANFVVHAVTTPEKLETLVTAAGALLREQATAIDPVHLERARNQLAFARVRASERPYATMERAVEELFAGGTVTPVPQALALIDDIGAGEVRAVFESMLRLPPSLALTGKGASARAAKDLAGRLAAAAR